MKLDYVNIARYRSAQDLHLENVGALNVLIGKNNSGKSTILSAIDIFFRCLRGGRLVLVTPPIGRTIDFSQQLVKDPILLTLRFSLLRAEWDALVTNIASEAPQLKNAIDGLDPALSLEATVAITPEPNNYSYVKSLYLVAPSGTTVPTVKRLVLGINEKAAAELASRQVTLLSSTDSAEALGRTISAFEEDDFTRLKQRSAVDPSFSYTRLGVLRRTAGELPRPAAEAVDDVFRESASYSEFRTKLTDLKESFAQMARTAEQEALSNTVETFSGNQSSIPSYVLKLVGAISDVRVLYLTERRGPVGKAEARQLLTFKITRGGPEKLRYIQQTIESLLGVQVDAFESPSGSPAAEKSAEMDVDNFLLEVNGSGIKEALRLVLDVEFKKPSILLVEEPEVHLHPALEINMMRYLKHVSRDCQVFLSTHSTNFLDTADMRNVYFVSKPETATEIQLLNVQEAESKLPKELGIRLSSLFMFDRIVFVEGPTDEAIIREWASTLNINLSQANVGFISMGGVRNFAHYANETIFNFLTKRQVGIWFIIDRDERNQAEVEKIEAKLLGKAQVEVLDRREIENYLLVPRALEAFIKIKQEMLPVGNYPEATEPSVSRAIDECAESLKDHAIGKRILKKICTPIYPNLAWGPEHRTQDAEALVHGEILRLRQGLDEKELNAKRVIEEAKQEVERNWGYNKSALVPGDILLDEVCKRFNVRFKKDGDGARLASLMNEHEIDGEIKRMILKFGR